MPPIQAARAACAQRQRTVTAAPSPPHLHSFFFTFVVVASSAAKQLRRRSAAAATPGTAHALKAAAARGGAEVKPEAWKKVHACVGGRGPVGVIPRGVVNAGQCGQAFRRAKDTLRKLRLCARRVEEQSVLSAAHTRPARPGVCTTAGAVMRV